MTRVLVCGGRHYADSERVFAVLNNYDADHSFTLLIQGGSTGADDAAARWASIGGTPIRTFRAAWRKHGNAAGPIRNQRMLDEGKPDLVIAFPGGRGTADMVRRARAAGVEVVEVSS